MPRTRKLFQALTRRGPHKALRGDLAFAGLPGVVYTPESGLNLAGVAFGHDWMAGAAHYHGTLDGYGYPKPARLEDYAWLRSQVGATITQAAARIGVSERTGRRYERELCAAQTPQTAGGSR